LSKRLTKEFERIFKRSNIYYFVQFYKTYPDIFHSASGQSLLSWSPSYYIATTSDNVMDNIKRYIKNQGEKDAKRTEDKIISKQ